MRKSCARTVLRPFSVARFVAWTMSQPTYALRPSSASPAVLHPASLIVWRTFDATSSISGGAATGAAFPFFALAILLLLFRKRNPALLHHPDAAKGLRAGFSPIRRDLPRSGRGLAEVWPKSG